MTSAAAQRPKASSSGSHVRGWTRSRLSISCSTPEGVIVSITIERINRSSSRFPGTVCSTPEGVIVSGSHPDLVKPTRGEDLLNARRRHRRDHPVRGLASFTVVYLLNARRRHRRDHTTRSAEEKPAPGLLNARRRHRRDHAVAVLGASKACSTPGGVIVSITCRLVSGATCIVDWWPEGCSTPEGVIVSITPEPRHRQRAGSVHRLLNARRRHRLDHQRRLSHADGPSLLNARRRHRLDHRRSAERVSPARAAQRPKASSSRSRRAVRQRGRPQGLLNARRRHRLDHPPMSDRLHGGSTSCSTPEGVIVSITTRRRSVIGSTAELLNARRRHRLDHRRRPSVAKDCCSTPEGVIVSITRPPKAASRAVDASAQRPKASSSRSRPDGARPGRRNGCSTPEGVIVSITPATDRRPRGSGCSTPEGVIVSITAIEPKRSAASGAAQRPKASSSRSPSSRQESTPARRLLNARRRHRLDHNAGPTRSMAGCLLNARRRHRLDHTGRGGRSPIRSAAQRPEASSSRSRNDTGRRPARSCCSTPEGVIVSITRRAGRSVAARSWICSTPEGVIVSITGSPSARSGVGVAAQRPKASSSRSPGLAIPPGASTCSTPEGVIVWDHETGAEGPSHAGEDCSTPEGVIVSITRGAVPLGNVRTFCSTPEGVIVWVTRSRQDRGQRSIDCSTPEGVIVSITTRQVRRIRG